MGRNDPVDIDVEEVVRITDKAMLVRVEGSEIWIPKSQLDPESEELDVGDSGVIVIPEWLAEDKGLI